MSARSAPSLPSPPLPRSFKLCLLLSAVLHAALIVYGGYQDAHSPVKYTDVDYAVFSDAARAVWSGLGSHGRSAAAAAADRAGRTVGPWGGWIGSPFDRSTYRYTPLLAVLLTPNHALHPAFGKVLFSVCDLLIGYLLFLLFPRRGQPDGSSSPTRWIAGLWLLNPFPLNIATRGSSESVLGALILLSLYCLTRGPVRPSRSLSRSEVAGSILLGLAVHVKIYPVVFACALLGFFGRASPSLLGRLGLTRKGVEFALVSGGSFALATLACYLVWGFEALYHPYLYHLTRLDHRHNFSPYFLPIYLLSAPDASAPSTDARVALVQRVIRSPLASFVPQLGLASVLAWAYGRRGELAMGWAVSTAVFVAFNKVVTSQYFIWYLSLLPLVLPRVHLSRPKSVALTSAWVLAQALWLSQAYRLEFLGDSVFTRVWAASIAFLGVNAWVLGELIGGFQ